MGSSQKVSEGFETAGEFEVRPMRQRAARLPAGERRAAILREAAIFFSEQGFSASTRDLADRLGVRQALLYKYYPSKEALIDSIFEAVFADHHTMDWATVLFDRNLSLADRICTFYLRYIQDTDGIGLRLFLRAALDGWVLPARLSDVLNEKLFSPLVAELRHEGQFPDLQQRPLLQGEYELVVMLHGAVIFNRMRAHIYRMKVVADFAAVIELYVRTFLEGARKQLAAMHNGQAAEALTVHS